MSTLVNANVWIYFTNTDDADKVKCKICRKSLNSKRSFNLRQHLKYTHKIEVRTDKRNSNKKKHQLQNTISNETVSFTSSLYDIPSLESKNDHDKTTSAQPLDSNDSYSRLSASPNSIDIKEEFLDVLERDEAEISTEPSNRQNDTTVEKIKQNTSIQSPHNSHNELFVQHPTTLSKENGKGSPNGSDLTDSDELKTRPKKKKSIRLANEGTAGAEKFEQWFKKKKQFLEMEEFEMRNYKLKLELWEKEQQLRIGCSKFTKDIKRDH